MRMRSARLGTFAACFVLLTLASPAWALRPGQATADAETSVREVEAKLGGIRAQAAKLVRKEISPQRRIAEGDILLRNKDYARAIHTLSQVDELFRQGSVPAAAHADALFLLGESYFADQQLLSARRRYLEILDRSGEPAYAPFAGRSLSRLVDIALRTDDPEAVDALAARLTQLPDSDVTGSLQYARGKVAFARRDYGAARRDLSAVPAGSPYSHQSQYLLGVVLTKEALTDGATPAAAVPGEVPPAAEARMRFATAIDQFRRVTRMPATTTEHRHVVDLAWMAIGRLFYELDNYLDAADAYSHVDRRSPEFSTMLYELAWVYVRLGDHQRAQRALEVLAVTDPDRLELADGSLLRADLMLRSGQFEKALKVYESVRQRFDPIRDQLNTFLTETSDPAAYYDQLLDDSDIALVGERRLPPIVLAWARQEAEDANVFEMIDDVNRSRALLRDSRTLAGKLNALLGSVTRVKAFPEVQAALEDVLGPMNRLSLARRTLALGMDGAADREVSATLAGVREQRRALMRRVTQMPVSEADFQRREDSGKRQWNELSQELQRLELQSDKLQALVNGLKRVVEEPDGYGVTADQATRERFKAEITANEQGIAAFRARIEEYRKAVEYGRVQIGFGDQRYLEDERTRTQFAALFEREVGLVAAGEDGPGARDYARSITPLLERIARAEAQLLPTRTRLEELAGQRAKALLDQVAREVGNLELYATQLDGLDHEARLLVGEVAMRNFAAVRERLKSIVLRADIGIAQEAWEVREEQRIRVNNLKRERADENRKLDDELREVLDDVEEGK
ncbi:MAG: tetratricopeptide repeat protein [Polyangiaceae bacterium]|nr:tetratricopeptide repeat protein [Polyangiaceae bacterium]